VRGRREENCEETERQEERHKETRELAKGIHTRRDRGVDRNTVALGSILLRNFFFLFLPSSFFASFLKILVCLLALQFFLYLSFVSKEREG
jgi:hypothetical protein